MLLKKLVKNLDVIKTVGDLNVDFVDVVTESAKSCPGSLFVCLTGKDVDGHNFAVQAVNYGAIAVVSEREIDVHAVQIIVKDTRKALSIIASEYYGRVHEKLKIVGVTGTNGKTTTTHMIADVLNGSGISAGIIGTIGTFYKDKFIEPTLTTPDPLTLHKTFFDMYESGVKVVVMEVSAHALYWQKLSGIKFDVAIFTNFTRDHLDFFKDMQEYKNAKLKFFKEFTPNFIISNSDDEVGVEITKLASNVITYGVDNPADVFAIEIENSNNSTSFVMNLFDCIFNVETSFIGKFNVLNILASCTAAALLGVKTKDIARNVVRLNPVKGRMEKVYSGDFSVYVDYAHTPDGLEQSLKALRPYCKNRLINVFGCGGNRDMGKREKMGEISATLADFSVITSDNPRFEDPMSIIRAVEKGFYDKSKDYVLIEWREDGIRYAVNMAKKGDVILIAGKGGEEYQEILGIKKPYNDKDTVMEILRELKL